MSKYKIEIDLPRQVGDTLWIDRWGQLDLVTIIGVQGSFKTVNGEVIMNYGSYNACYRGGTINVDFKAKPYTKKDIADIVYNMFYK